MGYPPVRSGVPPRKDLGKGYPLRKDLGPETWQEPGTRVPTRKDLRPVTWERTWDWDTPWKGTRIRHLGKNLGLGYLPPTHPRCGLTNKLKILPSSILRMRAVIRCIETRFRTNNLIGPIGGVLCYTRKVAS